MDQRTPTPTRPEVDEVRALRGEVALLRQELAELRRSLAQEVRTRRLVVVEEDGFERIDASADGHGGSIIVRARDDSWAIVAADDIGSENNVQAAAYRLVDGGNTAAEFVVRRDFDCLDKTHTELEIWKRPGKGAGGPGMVFDDEGVKLSPMRLFSETTCVHELLDLEA